MLFEFIFPIFSKYYINNALTIVLSSTIDQCPGHVAGGSHCVFLYVPCTGTGMVRTVNVTATTRWPRRRPRALLKFFFLYASCRTIYYYITTLTQIVNEKSYN